MKQIREDGMYETGDPLKEENSSDEDDLWDEKPIPDNKAVVDMEIDVPDRESCDPDCDSDKLTDVHLPSAWVAPKTVEKAEPTEASDHGTEWADFESFGQQQEPSHEKSASGEESGSSEPIQTDESDSMPCKVHSAETGSETPVVEPDAAKS